MGRPTPRYGVPVPNAAAEAEWSLYAMTCTEAARAARVSVKRIRAACNAGELAYFKAGKGYSIGRQALISWMATQAAKQRAFKTLRVRTA